MRFHFGKLKPRREKVFIGVTDDGEQAYLELIAPSAGLISSIAEDLPEPVVPRSGDWLRDKFGRIEKSADGKQLRALNPDDPAYKQAARKVETQRLIAMTIAMLAPGQVDFEAQRESFKSPADYWAAVEAEVESELEDQAAIDALVATALRLRNSLPLVEREPEAEFGDGERAEQPAEVEEPEAVASPAA